MSITDQLPAIFAFYPVALVMMWAKALGVIRRCMIERAGMAEPLQMSAPYIVELGDVFAGLADEEKEEIVAAALDRSWNSIPKANRAYWIRPLPSAKAWQW